MIVVKVISFFTVGTRGGSDSSDSNYISDHSKRGGGGTKETKNVGTLFVNHFFYTNGEV